MLAEWYELLEANARVGGAHLRLSRKFLFQPQRSRDAAGMGDRVLVSNRRGTTGMDEHILQQLTQARRDHDLAAFRAVAHGPGGYRAIGEPPGSAEDLAAITVVNGREPVRSPDRPPSVAARIRTGEPGAAHQEDRPAHQVVR